ncbi:MAG: 3-oxoacyl-ACP reductase [Thiotrichales bacterium]|nr:3-oxoacyl-ACP reductase [Thiotrichales bacterium]|tara:strand:- start:1854 stop:2621 length:768 start_codon:yes stop_codon:yes gene_type:complete
MSAYACYPSLEDRTVLVTGGGSGIGASLVEHFVGQGSKVAFVDVATEPSQALVESLDGHGRHAPQFFQCDVTDTGALERTIGDIGEALGPIKVLVNNAGNDDRHEFDSVDPDYWDQRMSVLVRHQFFACKAVYAGMKQAGGGSIINFSSTTWLMGEGGYVCYTTAKAAIYGMTRSLARDFGAADIRVNTVLPGWVMTERQLSLWVTPEAEREIEEKQALKHKLMPADVARMVLFLAADDSAMTTGQSFIIDGGWL